MNKTYTFKGKLTMSGMKWETNVDAIDSESAVAYIEKAYPTFKWSEITESI